MEVKFQNTWFGPEGKRYRASSVHELEDSMLPLLPNSAMIDGKRVGEIRKAPVAPKTPAAKPSKSDDD